MIYPSGFYALSQFLYSIQFKEWQMIGPPLLSAVEGMPPVPWHWLFNVDDMWKELALPPASHCSMVILLTLI
jgi:hypothetical protein